MHGYSVIWYKVSQSTEVTDYEDGSLMGELVFLTMEMNYSQNANCIYWRECEVLNIFLWLQNHLHDTIMFYIIKIYITFVTQVYQSFHFLKEKLWFNQRVNFKDATPEFGRKSMKIWAINNYGRKEHANTPF